MCSTQAILGPSVGAWIRERAFSFPCSREADAPRAMEATPTTAKRQSNSRRQGRNGHGAEEKISKNLSDSGFGGKYLIGGTGLRLAKGHRMNPTKSCIAFPRPCVFPPGGTGYRMCTHGGRFPSLGTLAKGRTISGSDRFHPMQTVALATPNPTQAAIAPDSCARRPQSLLQAGIPIP
jgi:hypothetical protein